MTSHTYELFTQRLREAEASNALVVMGKLILFHLSWLDTDLEALQLLARAASILLVQVGFPRIESSRQLK